MPGKPPPGRRVPRRRRGRGGARSATGFVLLLLGGVFVGAVIASALAESAGLSVPRPPTTTTSVASESGDLAQEEVPAGDLESEPEDEPGGHRERSHPPSADGKARAAGEPTEVVRAFARAWINRPTDRRELARQNRRLVSLSRGSWADSLAATLKGGGEGRGSRGSVVDVEFVRRDRASVVALVTTREQLAPDGEPLEPYHYALYLARLQRAGAGFAVSSWEPQF